MKTKTRLSLGFGGQILLAAILGIYVMLGLTDVKQQFSIVVEHDAPIVANARYLSRLVVDMENGQRGFCIVQKEEFLAPYVAGFKKFKTVIEKEKKLVSDNPGQVEALERIEYLVHEWQEKAANPEIAMARKVALHVIDAQQLQDILRQGVGKKLMDRIMALGHEIEVSFSDRKDWEGAFVVEIIEKCMTEKEDSQRGFLITGKEEFLEKYTAGEQKKLPENFARLRAIVSERGRDDELSKKIDRLEQLTHEWTEKAAEPEIAARREMNKNPESLKDVAALLEAGTGKALIDEIRKELNRFIEIEEDLATQRYDSASETAVKTRNIAVTLLFLALCFGVTIAVVTSRAISNPLTKLAWGAERVGSGDLDTRVDVESSDEIGDLSRAFNNMTKSLREVSLMSKQAEAALRESEGNLSITLNSIGDAVMATDTEGRVVRMNPIAEKLTGWSLSEAKGRSIIEVFNILNEETRKRVESPVEKVMREGVIVGLINHTVLISRDGTEHPIDDSGAPIKNDQGDIVGVVLVFHDVAEKREAEKALQESEAQFRELFDRMPAGVVIYEARGNGEDFVFTDINLAGKRISKVTQDNIIGSSVLEIFPGVQDMGLFDVFQNVWRTGTPIHYPATLYKDQRVSHWVENEVYKLSSGEIVAIYEDITERKLAEVALKESQETFLTVMDGIDATIYVADMETYEILFMNKFMKDSLGEDFTGKICWKAFRQESGPCSYCTNDKLLDEAGNPAGAQVWTDQNPVNGRWYISCDRAIKWVDGRYVRLQVATDITELKKLEARLQQAQKMEAIGTLAGGIAHDFNNILFPIFGYLEMMLEDVPADNPLHGHLIKVFNGAKLARDLIKQILTFSRQTEHEKKPLKMQLVIKEVLKLIRSSLPTTIDIRHDISNECELVMADPTQIHQIAMNLITNAYHAMEETGGKLTVNLKEVELTAKDLKDPDMIPGPHVCLTVADTGTGIEQSIMDRMFDPYFTTKEEGKGTGLGLSVIHGIIKSHGGHISVYSEPGKGTEFKVYLPVIKPQETAQQVEADLPIQKGTERILLVDDQDIIVDMERQMLERLGYRVTARTSSTDALEAFRTQPDEFDLVITDMTMPNMTGDKLAGELIKIRSDIPVILCTGFSEMMSRENAAALEIKGFLMKPVVMKELSSAIRKVMDD